MAKLGVKAVFTQMAHRTAHCSCLKAAFSMPIKCVSKMSHTKVEILLYLCCPLLKYWLFLFIVYFTPQDKFKIVPGVSNRMQPKTISPFFELGALLCIIYWAP